jgi:hypothetical protein
MRLWRAELELERQKVQLKKGDSYVIPRGAEHRFRILEPFSAVEATAPPAHVHGRDEVSLPRNRIRKISTLLQRRPLDAHPRTAECIAPKEDDSPRGFDWYTICTFHRHVAGAILPRKANGHPEFEHQRL